MRLLSFGKLCMRDKSQPDLQCKMGQLAGWSRRGNSFCRECNLWSTKQSGLR